MGNWVSIKADNLLHRSEQAKITKVDHLKGMIGKFLNTLPTLKQLN